MLYCISASNWRLVALRVLERDWDTNSLVMKADFLIFRRISDLVVYLITLLPSISGHSTLAMPPCGNKYICDDGCVKSVFFVLLRSSICLRCYAQASQWLATDSEWFYMETRCLRVAGFLRYMLIVLDDKSHFLCAKYFCFFARCSF